MSDPTQIDFTLEGCRNNGAIALPNGSGQFVCPDAAYTTDDHVADLGVLARQRGEAVDVAVDAELRRARGARREQERHRRDHGANHE